MKDAAPAIAALHDFAPPHRPYVSYGFLSLSLAITIPTLIQPELYDVFGGLEPRRYPWQIFTAVFEHGWPGFHGSIHLALNAFLILECGRPCERLLGWRPFLTLSVAAAAANAGTQLLTEAVNGSSLGIWAWGPPLYLALRRVARRNPAVRETVHYERIRMVLILMYVVVVIAMGAIPYLSGRRGNPILALAMGNLYHLVAAGVGLAFTLVWSRHIESRLADLAVAQRRREDLAPHGDGATRAGG